MKKSIAKINLLALMTIFMLAWLLSAYGEQAQQAVTPTAVAVVETSASPTLQLEKTATSAASSTPTATALPATATPTLTPTATDIPTLAPTVTDTPEPVTEIEVEYWGGLPTPADVFNLSADSNGPEGSLTATSFSDLDAVLAMYRRELAQQGWQEQVEATVIDETSASLVFEDHETLLRLELHQPEGELTDIYLTSSVAEGATVEVDLMALPRPENIKVLLEQPDYLRYDSPDDLDTLLAFYRQELTARGWREQEWAGHIDNWAASRFFQKGNFSLNLIINEFGIHKTGVDLDLTNMAAEAAGETTASTP